MRKHTLLNRTLGTLGVVALLLAAVAPARAGYIAPEYDFSTDCPCFPFLRGPRMFPSSRGGPVLARIYSRWGWRDAATVTGTKTP